MIYSFFCLVSTEVFYFIYFSYYLSLYVLHCDKLLPQTLFHNLYFTNSDFLHFKQTCYYLTTYRVHIYFQLHQLYFLLPQF